MFPTCIYYIVISLPIRIRTFYLENPRDIPSVRFDRKCKIGGLVCKGSSSGSETARAYGRVSVPSVAEIQGQRWLASKNGRAGREVIACWVIYLVILVDRPRGRGTRHGGKPVPSTPTRGANHRHRWKLKTHFITRLILCYPLVASGLAPPANRLYDPLLSSFRSSRPLRHSALSSHPAVPAAPRSPRTDLI